MVKDKERLSMYVDITRITITLCWIALIAFWCLKLFGGNWFEIMVENENFIKFSELLQNTWLKYIVSFFTICIAKYIVFGAMLQQFTFKGKQLAIIGFCCLSIWAVANFVPNNFLNMPFWYGYVLYIIIPIIYQKKWKKCLGAVSIILELAFTSISMLTRNIRLQMMTDYLITMILIIDLYIMYVLYYLYSNLIKLKGENDMAILIGTGWLSKESAQINGYNSWRRFWHNVGYGLSFKWAKKK